LLIVTFPPGLPLRAANGYPMRNHPNPRNREHGKNYEKHNKNRREDQHEKHQPKHDSRVSHY